MGLQRLILLVTSAMVAFVVVKRLGSRGGLFSREVIPMLFSIWGIVGLICMLVIQIFLAWLSGL